MPGIQKTSRSLQISLWSVQVILATLMGFAGFLKSSQPIDQLSATLPWTTQFPEGMVRFIGISELLGALGLLLPSLLRIKPILTPIAAFGLAIVQILAISYHVSQGESSVIGLNLSILLLAAFVVWGRWKKAPIASGVQ